MTLFFLLKPILILLTGAALIPIITRIEKLFRVKHTEKIVTFFSLVFSFYSLLILANYIMTEGHIEYYLIGFLPQQGGVVFYIDFMSIYFSLLFTGLGLLTSVYSFKYMEKDTGQDLYYMLLLILIAGMIGVSFSGDFFNFFVFWEMMCISSYTLVSFRKDRWEPIEAGFKYLIMSTIGSLLILFSISLLYGVTGTVNFRLLGVALSHLTDTELLSWYLPIGLVIAGFGVTAAVVPFHTWLPDAHIGAPCSFSAMLSGVISKIGIYGIIKILFTVFNPVEFNFSTLLVVLSVITISTGNFMTLLQSDIKRFLAYSSIVNIGYILSGIGIGGYVITEYYSISPQSSLTIAVIAITGGLLHIFNHTVGKSLAFFCSGCFLHATDKRDITFLEGIGRKMRLTGISLSIALLSLAGIPPFSGFWSKFFIIMSGLSIPTDNFLTIVTTLIILNSIFTSAYYVWLIQRIIIKKPKKALSTVKEAPISMIVPIVILAVIIVIFGVIPGPLINLAEYIAKLLLINL